MVSRTKLALLTTAVLVPLVLIALSMSLAVAQGDELDVGVFKSDDPDPVIAGEDLSYTILVTNSDGVTATNVLVTDTLPLEVEYITNTGNCLENSGLLTCTLDDLDPGGVFSFTINVHVPPEAFDPDDREICNSVEVSATTDLGEGDTNLLNNTDEECTELLGELDVGILKSDDPDPVIAGEDLSYTIRVTNSFGVTATDVVVTDTLPLEVEYITNTDTCTLSEGTGPFGEDQLICLPGDLDLGEEVSFTIDVDVAPDAFDPYDPQICNSVVVSATTELGAGDTNLANNTEQECTTLLEEADLTMEKSVFPGDVVPFGEWFSYTLSVENLGPSSSRVPIVMDWFATDGSLSLIAGEDGVCGPMPTDQGWAETPAWLLNWVDAVCDLTGDPYFCDAIEPWWDAWWAYWYNSFPPNYPYPLAVDWMCIWYTDGLEPGEPFPLTVDVLPLDAQTVYNQAWVVPDMYPYNWFEEWYDGDGWGTPDPDMSNNMDEVVTQVGDVADLAIQKWWEEAPEAPIDCYRYYTPTAELVGVVAGCSLRYGLVITNTGLSLAENVVVEDFLPAGVVVENVGAQQGSCTTGIPGNPEAPLTCNLGNIPPGEDRRIDIIVVADSDLAWEHLENDAVVSNDIPDPDDANNRSHVLTWVEPFSYLNVVKHGPEEIRAGEEIQYWIDLWNDGPSTAHDVHLEDELPGGVSLLDAQVMIGDGSCAPNSTLCSLGDVAPHEWNSVRVRGYVEPRLADGTWITNTVRAWADSPFFQPVPEQPISDTVETLVHSAADLSIQKTSEPMRVYPGEEKVYHIEVTNHGPADAPDVIVTDTLPSAVDYEIDNDNCNLVTENPDVLECHLGTIPAGQTVGFDISALVFADAPPVEITNTAVVSMPYDTNPGNNTAWATNLVLEPIFADLSLQKSFGEAPAGAFGEGWAYGPEDCYLYDEGMNLYGIRAGCPLTYTLVITNGGPLVAENVVVEDSLPAGVVVENVGAEQGSCTTGIPGNPEAPLTCNLGNVPPGEDRRIDIIAVSDSDLAWEHLENDAVVSSDIPDPDDANNRAHVLTWVEPFSYLNVDKQGPEEIRAGEEIQYWIKLWNEGPSTAHNVHLDDELPGKVSLLDAQVMIGDGSCAPNSTLCSLGDVAPHEWNSVRVRGYVEPWVEAGTIITNTVRAWADSPFYQPLPEQPISDTWQTLVHSAADLSIRKTADPYKVYAGEQVRYDVSVTNNGPSVAYSVTVTDTLDPGVEFELATTGCDYTPPTMLGSSQPSYGGELFSVDLGTGAGSPIGEMPEWLAAEIEYDNLSDRLFAAEGFAPWYGDGVGPRLYELDPLTGAEIMSVTLTEPCALPGLEFVDGTLYGTCSNSPGGDPHLVTIDPDTGDVTPVGGDMYVYDLIHGLAYDESSGIMYGLEAGDETDNDLWQIDLDDGEAHWLCDIWDVDDGYYEDDLRSIEFGPDGVLYGGLSGDSDLVRIDIAPDEGYCDMHRIGDTGFSITGLTLMGPESAVCPLGDIPPGETASFSIFVRVKPDTLGLIHNTVDVSSDNDPNLGNNSYTEANLVLGKADLRVLKYGKPHGVVEAGERLTYTVIVDNLGPGYAHEVVLYDLFSSSSWAYYFDDWRSDRDAECWYDEWGRDTNITCRLDDPLEVMSPSSSGRWVLKFYFELFEEQSVNNVANVVGADFDPDHSNNHAITEHEITAVADLDLDKIAEGEVLVGCEGETQLWEDEVAAGGMLTYTLEIYNDGPSDAENVVVEDWGLSPFLDILDVECQKYDDEEECSCNLSGLGELGDTNRHLVCYLGTIEDEDEDQIIITARIPSDVPEGTRLVNDARVYGDVFDDDNGDNLAGNWTYVLATADLGVEKSQEPETTLPGLEVVYTIRVDNLGPSDAHGVLISDTLPFNATSLTVEGCASDGGQCDVPCEVPTCPAGECPWPDVDFVAQANIPAGEHVIYTLTAIPEWVPCEPITNTVQVVAEYEYEHDIDPCDENDFAYTQSDPECNFVPLALKSYPGPDSPP
jgi:uncharacterized repeat protein (TIGR01451 family)